MAQLKDTIVTGDLTVSGKVNGREIATDGLKLDTTVVGPVSSVNNSIPVFDGVTGKLLKDASGVNIESGNIVGSNASFIISTNTVDGADNKRLLISGGGGVGNGRGGYINIYGNESVGNEGNLDLLAGNSAQGKIRFYTGTASERMQIQKEGNIGIGSGALGSALGKLDVSSGGLSLVIGADSGADTRTNATNKVGRISGAHYTNAEEVSALILCANDATTNVINIGGGTSSMNAATKISFYTAANNTTLVGSERMTILSDGKVGIGTNNPSEKLHVIGNVLASGTINGVTMSNVVQGPADSADSYIPVFDGETGKLLKRQYAWKINGSNLYGGSNCSIQLYNSTLDSNKFTILTGSYNDEPVLRLGRNTTQLHEICAKHDTTGGNGNNLTFKLWNNGAGSGQRVDLVTLNVPYLGTAGSMSVLGDIKSINGSVEILGTGNLISKLDTTNIETGIKIFEVAKSINCNVLNTEVTLFTVPAGKQCKVGGDSGPYWSMFYDTITTALTVAPELTVTWYDISGSLSTYTLYPGTNKDWYNALILCSPVIGPGAVKLKVTIAATGSTTTSFMIATKIMYK